MLFCDLLIVSSHRAVGLSFVCPPGMIELFKYGFNADIFVCCIGAAVSTCLSNMFSQSLSYVLLFLACTISPYVSSFYL